MIREGRTTLAAALVSLFLAAPVAAEDDPALLSAAVGVFSVDQDRNRAAEFRLEYRSNLKLWIFKPMAAVAATSDGSVFLGAGILADIVLGSRFVLTGSVLANYYVQGSSDLDLGYPLEFRSQAEIAYRFDDRSRLGIALSHYSNAGIGDTNPGTETVSLYYSVPLGPASGDAE